MLSNNSLILINLLLTQLINIMNKIFLLFLIFTIIFVSSCRKRDIEDLQRETQELRTQNNNLQSQINNQAAKTYEFNMIIPQGESTNFWDGQVTGFKNGDVLLMFSLFAEFGEEFYWNALPVSFGDITFVGNFEENSGQFWLDLIDGITGDEFIAQSDVVVTCRLVHVKSSFIQENPEFNNFEYNELIDKISKY